MKPAPIFPISEVCSVCPVGHRGCISFRVPMYCERARRGTEADMEAIRKASGVEPPPPDPSPPVFARAKTRTPSDIPRAHPSQLTDDQRAAVETCSHRGVGQACCGPVDVCDLGRGWGRNGRRIDTAVCCGCVLAGLER